ncbi:MAG TPA: hypothetical protein VK426_00160 [Methanobacterium sp.]|nr:hypothetical protein [Methanobacterium sp.]
MNEICIVASGKKKIWDRNTPTGPVKSRELYKGLFTQKCIKYAEKFHKDSYYVLSAKYGFLLPEETIESPYNECFHIKKTNPITLDELSSQIRNKQLNKYDKIVILGGKYYMEMIKILFPKKDIINPLKGCKGIGDMMKKLNELISLNNE